MPKIKLNFQGDQLTNSNISVVVEEEEVEDLLEEWENELEKVGEDEYDLNFAWAMVEDAIDSYELGLVFVWKQIHYDCDIDSNDGPFTIEEYQLDGANNQSVISEWKFYLVKDANDNYIEPGGTTLKMCEEYVEDNCGIGDTSFGIFQKVVWDKITKEDLKYQY